MPGSRSKRSKNSSGNRGKFSQLLCHHRYAVDNVLRSLWQSRWTVVVNSIILGLSLSIPLALANIAVHFDVFSENLKPPVSLYLQLRDTANHSSPGDLVASLGEDPRVSTVSLISREDILKRVLQQLDIEQSSSLDAINPFTNTINITLVHANSATRDISDFINELQTNYSFHQIDISEDSGVSQWQDLLALPHRFAFAVSVVFLFSAVLACGYMVRNQILRRHLEIEVTRYCGADKAFIRRPFLYWGTLQACLGAACAGAIVQVCFALLVPPMNAFTSATETDSLQQFFYLGELLTTLAAGSVLGLVSAWIATILHLKAGVGAEIP